VGGVDSGTRLPFFQELKTLLRTKNLLAKKKKKKKEQGACLTSKSYYFFNLHAKVCLFPIMNIHGKYVGL